MKTKLRNFIIGTMFVCGAVTIFCSVARLESNRNASFADCILGILLGFVFVGVGVLADVMFAVFADYEEVKAENEQLQDECERLFNRRNELFEIETEPVNRPVFSMSREEFKKAFESESEKD